MKKFLQAGMNLFQGMSLNLFSEDELYLLHCATLEVMSDIGIKVTGAEARQIFEDNGAFVDHDKQLVRIPAYMVEDAIRSAPSTMLLAGRDPQYDYLVQGKSVAYTNFGEALKIVNPRTRQKELSTKKWVEDTTRMCDAMENIDVVERACGADDVPPQVQSIHNFEAIVNNTSKHIFMGANCGYNARRVLEMAAAVVGGKEKLRERPIWTPLLCPNSPLTLNPDCTEVLYETAQAGTPAVVISMALAGGTTPVTPAGTLVCHNAEVLSGVVFSQLVRKGAPVIYGSSTTLMDMRFTTAAVGAPELGILNAGVAKLSQFYQLPSFVAGG